MDEKKISFRYISKNMAGAQKLMKQMKSGHWLMLIVVVVLVIAVYNYSNGKGVARDGMANGVAASLAQVGGAVMGAEERIVGGGAGVEPSPAAEGQSSDFASAEGTKTSAHGMPPSAVQIQKLNAHELLPKDHNSEWSAGGVSAKDVLNVNFASVNDRIGQLTNVSKIANLDLRRQPTIPKVDNISPWSVSTVEPEDPRFKWGLEV
jgi:hypothetical protein